MLRVADVMSVNLITLCPTDSLKTAKEIMHKARIRHLPIVSPQGSFVGILSQRNLLKATVSHFADVQDAVREQIEAGIPVSEIMSADVLSIPPDMPLTQAGSLLLTHKIGCLPVLDCGQLRGILTESDFVKLSLTLLERIYPEEGQGDTP